MGRRAKVTVDIREASIRLRFTWRGERQQETLKLPDGTPLPPTNPNTKRAHRIADEIQRHLDLDTLTEERFVDYFPHSDRAQQASDNDSRYLGPLLDLWLQTKGSKTASTRDQYATAVRFWKRLLGEKTRVDELTHARLAAKIGGYPWRSAKAHNNYLIALRGALGLVYRGPRAADSPLVGIENLAVVRRLPDPLSAAERDALLADLRDRYDPRVHAYFLFAFYTGMRPEEIIALRWSDYDARSKTIRVQRVRTFRGSERDGSKTHTVRDVFLVPQAEDALAVMARYTKMLRIEREGDDDTTADIFQNPVTRRPWHDERSQRDHYWKPALRRQGIRARRAYCTRHTFATVALMAGVPPAYIANQLGHSVQMLLTTYARWIPGGDTAARAALSAAMAGPTHKEQAA